jgi:hypothetical protein
MFSLIMQAVTDELALVAQWRDEAVDELFRVEYPCLS